MVIVSPLRIAVLSAVLGPLLSACSPGEQEPTEPPPHLIVITLDTVRADHLGCYDYLRDTSPNIDALARESLLFEQCLAPVSQTLPSHTTLFTGMQPHEHGALANRKTDQVYVPAPGAETLATVLGRAGFRIGGRPPE